MTADLCRSQSPPPQPCSYILTWNYAWLWVVGNFKTFLSAFIVSLVRIHQTFQEWSMIGNGCLLHGEGRVYRFETLWTSSLATIYDISWRKLLALVAWDLPCFSNAWLRTVSQETSVAASQTFLIYTSNTFHVTVQASPELISANFPVFSSQPCWVQGSRFMFVILFKLRAPRLILQNLISYTSLSCQLIACSHHVGHRVHFSSVWLVCLF